MNKRNLKAVASRNRAPLPEFPTRLTQSRLDRIRNDYRYPAPPYLPNCGCHWLWGWGTRSKEYFSEPGYAPSKEDWMVFYPCEESETALEEYARDSRLKVRVDLIRSAFEDAKQLFQKWVESEDFLPAYVQSVLEMSDKILANTEIIAQGLALHIGSESDPTPEDALMSRKAVLERLGDISTSRLSQLRKDHAFPPPKKTQGRKEFYSISEVDRWCSDHGFEKFV